jgi:RND family efflux transporter MFP subunit
LSATLRSELSSLHIDRSRRSRSLRVGSLVVGLALAGVLVGLGAGGYVWLKDRLNPPPLVRTDVVRMMTGRQLATVLTATGYLESRYQASVGAKVPGRVARILVEEGDKVVEGQLLAELEHKDLDAQLAERAAAVKRAEADLAEARHNLKQSERDYIREQQVRKDGAGTEAALEAAETAFKAAEVRVQALDAAVAVARARQQEAEVAIDYMKVYAPFKGTVLTKDADAGETIMPGGMGLASGRGSVATLADLDHLEVDTDVKEDFLSRVYRDQPCEVVVDAVTDRRYKGRVRQIIPIGDRSRGIVKVKVEVLDPDERLFPDLSATVHFLPLDSDPDQAAAERSPYVSQAALVSAGDETFVWKVVDDRAVRVTVAPKGAPADGLVAVDGSLAAGDVVIVDPPASIRPDAKVRTAE